MPIRAAPFAHQTAAFESAMSMFNSGKSHGYAFLMEMGTGKSLTAIAVTGRLYLDEKISRVLIVAPLSILGVWQAEFEKFADFPHILAILDGERRKKLDKLRHLNSAEALSVCVVNYESAKILEPEIAAWKPDLIICDEAHKIKSYKTETSKAMHRLGARANYRLILTGTLVTNHAEDVFSPYKFMNPAIFGTSYFSWRNRYFDAYGYGNYQYRLKKSMEPEFLRKVHSAAFKATKAECLDLPETTDIIRYVELEKPAARLYRELSKDCYAELESGEISATNILTKILRLSQLTGGFITNDEGKNTSVSKAKLYALSDIIEGLIEEGKKAVVIAKFTPEIAAIRRMLIKMGIGFVCVDGSTKDRAKEVKHFQEKTNVSVFIGQIACASLGITLTAASDLIFYSFDYSTANHSQARSRIHRNGQTEKCNYYYLLCKDTIDEKILKSLRDKSDFARQLIDEFRRGNNPFL